MSPDDPCRAAYRALLAERLQPIPKRPAAATARGPTAQWETRQLVNDIPDDDDEKVDG